MTTLKLLLASLIIALPISIVVTFLLTSVYWHLEPILGIELAGHSGPSEWVFELNFAIIAVIVFELLRRFARKRPRQT